MAVALKAPHGYFYRVLTGRKTAHLIPHGYASSLCGVDLYPLGRATKGTEGVCQSCTRELNRRLGEAKRS